MAAVACAGVAASTASAAVQWAPAASASSGVGASRSVAFRGAAVAVRPLRVCRKRQEEGVDVLQRRMQGLTVRASGEGESALALNKPQGSGKKKKMAVAPVKKQRVLLKFLWLEKNIGIALDQVVPGHGTIPLSPYFFWPRKDAWEQLKAKLDSKSWISRKRTIILLNQATDIINLWQQNAANL
ncbi:hypothetical protein KC19_VG282700 [Ceratodon purpureus]|uniref:30S ribosomal protein 3, chloroplastic n=1 Tax=Ceratodon purpureus TaxID=3225 RepID=A0A8T0HW78_CERPU|nr:hypothetical protein KC19_VG282700 [Ceratodon purpureus]